MSKLSCRLATVLAVLMVSGFAATAASADDLRQVGPVLSVAADGGNVEVAGASVSVTGTAARLRAAGALVNVSGTTTGDAGIAGAQIAVSGSIGGNLRSAGAVVDASGSVAGDVAVVGAVVRIGLSAASLRVAGASVTVAPNSDVRGRLQAVGAVLSIAGHIAGPVEVGGAVVTFDGTADGPVSLSGNRIVIGPDAHIAGDLIVKSASAPEVASGAVIGGQTIQQVPTAWWSVAPWKWAAIIAAAVAAGTILTGIVLMLFGGHVFASAVGNVRHRPVSSFLYGVLTVVVIKIVAIVLMVTVIGLTVGLAILMLMPLLVVSGHAVAATGIAGGVIVRRPGDMGVALSILMLVIGAIVLVAVAFIPWVGPLLFLLAVVLGMGAFARTFFGRLRMAPPPPV